MDAAKAITEATAAVAQTAEHVTDKLSKAAAENRLAKTVELTTRFGLPAVFFFVWLWFAYIPEQSARRQNEEQVRATMQQLANGYTAQLEVMRASSQTQSQTAQTLQQTERTLASILNVLERIQRDQANGAWLQRDKNSKEPSG